MSPPGAIRKAAIGHQNLSVIHIFFHFNKITSFDTRVFLVRNSRFALIIPTTLTVSIHWAEPKKFQWPVALKAL